MIYNWNKYWNIILYFLNNNIIIVKKNIYIYVIINLITKLKFYKKNYNILLLYK